MYDFYFLELNFCTFGQPWPMVYRIRCLSCKTTKVDRCQTGRNRYRESYKYNLYHIEVHLWDNVNESHIDDQHISWDS